MSSGRHRGAGPALGDPGRIRCANLISTPVGPSALRNQVVWRSTLLTDVILVLLAVGFAISIGAHYTGACMGMPHALGAVTKRQALLLMAPLALLGAALASHPVETTVALHLTSRRLDLTDEIVVIALAFALTSAYNHIKLPTSTIQLLVF